MNIFSLKLNKLALILLLFIFSLFFSKNVLATEIFLKTANQNVVVGDTVEVSVLVNTEGEQINVVEGALKIESGSELLAINDFSLANSVLKQWVRTPSWSEKDKSIYFVGGTPGGFNTQSAVLFKIFFTAKSTGELKLSPSDIKAYANDGSATQVGVHFSSVNINIIPRDKTEIKNELQNSLNQDQQAPVDIKTELGQDPSIFDGLKFIVISASDSGSGVDYFEVKEGNREPVKTSSNYVLQNQNQLEPMIIFAFDKAGNISQKKLVSSKSPEAAKDSHGNLKLFAYLLVGLCLIIAAFFLMKYLKKKIKFINHKRS